MNLINARDFKEHFPDDPMYAERLFSHSRRMCQTRTSKVTVKSMRRGVEVDESKPMQHIDAVELHAVATERIESSEVDSRIDPAIWNHILEIAKANL